MPKKQAAEAPFWDYEQHLGYVYPEEGARKCQEVKRAKKDDKDYIVITELRYFKRAGEEEETWNHIKGLSIPAHTFELVTELALENLAADPAIDPEEDTDNE